MSPTSLTLGMAVFDDYDGVYFSITAAMIYHDAVDRGVEFVVVDNNPASKEGQAVKKWVEGRVPKGKYFTYTEANGTAQPRNQVFANATSDVVLCIDPHVLLQPGAIEEVIAHYEERGPTCKDLMTGPMLMDRGAIAGMFQRPEWGKGALGKWSLPPAARNRRGGHRHFAEPEVYDMAPFEIWQQGMGLFSMRREHWVKFHPEFEGFGGCETYVMDRVRQEGGQVICLPRLGWTHRFVRPNGAPYRPRNNDKLRNYLIGFQALGRPLDEVLEHFRVSEEDGLALIKSRKHRVRASPASAPTKSPAKAARGHDSRIGPVRNRPTPAKVEVMNYTSVVVGHSNYGGTKLRGSPVATLLKTKVVHTDKLGGMQPRDIVYYIKEGACPAKTRQKAKGRLIWDPLDCFYNGRLRVESQKYWLAKYGELKFDDIIATSPACQAEMRLALPTKVNVHLVPHQCDPQVLIDNAVSSWHDPDGPVVYSGLSVFIKSKLETIQAACKKIGKEFVSNANQSVLKGASLALALRCSPYDSHINRHCKPQIKIENATAAGLPMVSTDDPATLSQRPELALTAVRADFGVDELAKAMRKALDGKSLSDPYTDEDFITDISHIVELAVDQVGPEVANRS